ncbi:hypothetical protein K438DRAFT_304358 [Mycena galopus ATCC 62051]|nr:hypothetical protein K438DRAFT_304358 [Mycena galopus ATCC 62051]
MAASLSAQLDALLSQLHSLDLSQLDPSLGDQLGCLNQAASDARKALQSTYSLPAPGLSGVTTSVESLSLGSASGLALSQDSDPPVFAAGGSNKSSHLAQATGLPLANNAAESFSLGSTPGLALSQDSEPPVFITRGSNRSLHLVEAPGRHLNSQDATSVKDREAPGPHLDFQDAQSVKDRESFPWVLLDIREDRPSQSTFSI